MKARGFLTKEEQHDIVESIKAAEHFSSGEIRIHLDNKCGADPKVKALKTFHILKMTDTRARNGVLIYVACQSKAFAVLGDKGINAVVPQGFWKDVCNSMADRFAAGRYGEGLSSAVLMIGEKLKQYFPYQKEDINELPDDISFDENDGED